MTEGGSTQAAARIPLAIRAVTFRVPRAQVWRQNWRGWLRPPLRLLGRLAVSAYASLYVCRSLGLDPSLAAIISGMVWTLAGLVLLLTVKDAARKAAAAFADAARPLVVELGAFDFRWGWAEREGYYRHWTEFSDITDGPECLSFVPKGRPALRVPKTAFETPAAAQAFLAQARALWEAARQRQAEHAPEAGPAVDTVWPPPPRRPAER